MKKLSILIFILCACITELPHKSGKSNSPEPSNTSTCYYRVNSSYIFIFILFQYKNTLNYISFGDENCRETFAKQLKREVQNTFWLSDKCIAVTLKDIDDAMNNPQKLNERIKYF